MELINATKFHASFTQGMDKNGREYLVVVVKGTFNIPANGGEPELASEQVPAVESDVFTGEPGYSSTLYESDYAPLKHRCDVVLNGSAYAPGGLATQSVEVGMKIASISKIFKVMGNRDWYSKEGEIRATRPQAFECMPINYDNAFGGVDNLHEDPSKHDAYYENPAGRGFHKVLDDELLHNTPLPNTEERDNPVLKPSGPYRPMSLGPIGRGWSPRRELAGTYDQAWIDNTFPFLPADFDEAHYQCAPPDQQTAYLAGGEEVQLVNLAPQERIRFRLPRVNVPVVFFRQRGEHEYKDAVVDTLVLEPDKSLFTMTWRTSVALKKNMFEIPQVLVGKKTKAWWRARESGKTYHESLASVVRSARAGAAEEELDT